MKWEMEVLSPPAYLSNSNCLLEESKSSKWTPEENKMFENALSVYDTDSSDRWQKVAAMIPGKTAEDVLKQYKELELDVGKIEAGLVPIPGYNTYPFTLEWSSNHKYQGLKQSPYGLGGKRPPPTRPTDQERKKGVPWTEEEHKLFLLGLKKYGKGDWRNISRNFVITRTPTQVASHAQKYFIRQLSGGKDKRRASIHDITTVNLTYSQTPSPENKRPPPSPDSSAGVPNPPNSAPMNRTTFQWCQPSNGAPMAFNPTHGNIFMSSPYAMNSYGLKIQGQNLHRAATFNESYIGPQNMDFQMQSAQHFPHG